MSLTRITNAILGNENTILTVSSYDEDLDVFIGEPTIINKNGVLKKIKIDLKDYQEITSYFTSDYISYENVIACMRELASKEWFQ